MKLERIVLLFSGLVILGSSLLPYFDLGSHFTESESSSLAFTGVEIVQTVLNQFDVLAFDKGEGLMNFLADKWNQAEGFEGLGLVVGLILVLGAPLWFGLHALGYVFRALRGRQYSHGIFFSLLFLGFGWLIFWLWGSVLEVDANFFYSTRIGFWVGFGGMILAAFSLFFENSSRKK